MAEAYLTFKGTTAGIVDAFYEKQALADAGATDAGITAKQGVLTIPDYYRPNKAYWDGTKLLEETPESVAFDAMSAEDQIKERRAYLIGLLQRWEAIGAKLSVWHGSRIDDLPEGDPPDEGDDDERLDQSKRTPSYGRWVEANTRAMLVDENLTTAVKWAWLKAECEISGETWYWLHKVNGTKGNGGWYERYKNNDRSAWVWAYTVGTTVTPNSRGAQQPPNGFFLTLDVTTDWVVALQ